MLVSPMSVSTIGLTDLIVSLASVVPRRLIALLEPNASAADGAAFSMSYVSGEDRGQETNPGPGAALLFSASPTPAVTPLDRFGHCETQESSPRNRDH